jgi:hypothetical protein
VICKWTCCHFLLIIRSLSNDHFGDSEERNTRTEISLW